MSLRKGFLLLVLFGALWSHGQAADITVDSTVQYQTIKAWSIADNLARMGAARGAHDPDPYGDVLARQLIDEAVNDLGITANRDCMLQSSTVWEPLNDDADPIHLTTSMVNTSSLPDAIAKRTQYFKQLIESHGEPCVLYDGNWQPQDAWQAYNPGEFSERVLSYLQFLKDNYGLTLDYFAVENEPGNANIYTAAMIGEIIKTLGPQLKSRGFSTKIELSEFLNTVTGWSYIQALQNDSDVWPYVGLLSYHLYDYNGTLDPSRSYIRDFGIARGLPTAETEGPNLNVSELFDDLTLGGVSIWSLYGWGAFLPSRADRTSFTHNNTIYWGIRQVTHYVRPGSVRIGANSTDATIRSLAFTNNGKVTVVMLSNPWTSPATVTVHNLPAGQYGVSSAAGNFPYKEMGIQTVGTSGTLTVNLPYADSTGAALTIYPYSGNQSPVITSWLATPDYLTLPASTISLAATAVDAEADPITYSWSVSTQPTGANAVIASPNAATTSVTALTTAGAYVFRLTVKDPTHTLTRDINFNVYPGNQPPDPSCTAKTLTLPASSTTLSVGVRDLENDPLIYSWTIVSQPAGASASLSAPTAASCPVSNLTVAGNYLFRVAVSDLKHPAATADLPITVYPSNAPPVISSASASPSTLTLPVSTTSLTAVTSDPDANAMIPFRADGSPDPLSHWWLVKSAPAGAKPVFANPATRNTVVSALSLPGTYVFTLRVMDRAAMVTQDVTVIVNPGSNQGPSISTQPSNQTVSAGQTATFTVLATGTATLTYQWSKNGSPISGATSASYTTPATILTDSGSTFTVKITNSVGSVTSNAATLTVQGGAPVIDGQPTNQTVNAGQTASFSVTAIGTGLSYQWKKNGTAIGNAAAASYTTPVTTAGDNGSMFACVVSNSAGSVTSSSATLTVNSPQIESPYGGTPWAIPGTIQAEDYDLGGEGIAYHDSDAGNNGGGYRNDSVDVRGCSDTGGGYQVGWTAAGEWLNYTLNVISKGSYTLNSRIASGGGGGTIHIEFDGINVSGPINIPDTGSYDTWQTLTQTVQLSAGPHIMRVSIDSGSFDMNWFSFTPLAANASPVLTSAASAIPNIVQTGQTVAFSAAASDPDSDPLNYSWSFGDGASAPGATTTHAYATAGTYTATVTISDGQGHSITSSTSVTVSAVVLSVLRINSGGRAVETFAADNSFNGGSTYSTTQTVSTAGVTSPAPKTVYQSERYGNFTYTAEGLIAGGTYTVRLHFAEIYWSSAGQRVFNVSINGQQVLSNFDIYAAAGGKYKAIVKEFTATATNGQIAIVYSTLRDNAKSSGIELVPVSGAASTSLATDVGAGADETDIGINSIDLGTFKVGSSFNVRLEMPESGAAAKKLRWSSAKDSKLPAGLRITAGALTGKAKKPGTYAFKLQMKTPDKETLVNCYSIRITK
jgi:hypothetical protein